MPCILYFQVLFQYFSPIYALPPVSYSLLPNLTEIAHTTQRVPYSEQLMHIQHRPYVFVSLRKEKIGRQSPTTHPASLSVFTQLFLSFVLFYGGGCLKIQQMKRQKNCN